MWYPRPLNRGPAVGEDNGDLFLDLDISFTSLGDHYHSIAMKCPKIQKNLCDENLDGHWSSHGPTTRQNSIAIPRQFDCGATSVASPPVKTTPHQLLCDGCLLFSCSGIIAIPVPKMPNIAGTSLVTATVEGRGKPSRAADPRSGRSANPTSYASQYWCSNLIPRVPLANLRPRRPSCEALREIRGPERAPW